MPKLDAKTAKRVQTGSEAAGSGEFEPLDEGFYRMRLRGVKVDALEKSKEPKLVGCPRWTWEFEIPEGEEHAGRRFWLSLILPADNGYQHADFMMSKFAMPFDAFGVSLDTDTDELIGNDVRGYIIQRVISGGSKEGQLKNEIETMTAWDGGAAAAKASDDDEYQF